MKRSLDKLLLLKPSHLIQNRCYLYSSSPQIHQFYNFNIAHCLESLADKTQLNQILNQLIINDAPIDNFSITKLIKSSVSLRGLSFSALLFTQFRHFFTTDLCNVVVREYTDSNKHRESLFVFSQMRKIDILPDASTVPALFKSVAQLCELEMGRALHCVCVKIGLENDVYAGTSLVHMYCVCLSIVEGQRMFDEMLVKNAVTWNALISGYVHYRKFKEAIEVFREMLREEEVEPGEVTMVSVLSACSHLGALNQGRWVHDCIVRNRLRLNVFVGTALMDMYAKCGVVEEAERVFEMMRMRNVYSWNVLISGYAMNGQGNRALEMFSRMTSEGFQPDEVTFLSVLCACCHQGLVEEGKMYFKSMIEEFRLRPRIEHYGCMVDLFGRAGFLDEAQGLIRTMHVKPDPVIWRALLGACRIHKNTRLGEQAIKNLLELEPDNAENYILLANIYSRGGRWAEVGKVRALMDSRQIKKMPGCSSIEIKNVIHEFMVSDVSDPAYKEIYSMLADMEEKLRTAGYVMDTEMVLYDLEEEEKERSLMYHSEKLALAFGLLRCPDDSTLRIVKNLRICVDCHGFFKLVSKVYKRDITVRDRNRFHHFVGGCCSCRDYW